MRKALRDGIVREATAAKAIADAAIADNGRALTDVERDTIDAHMKSANDLRTQGEAQAVLACDAALHAHQGHWFVRETLGLLRRSFARLDVSSRTLFALIEPGSCFVGMLAELAFAADRAVYLKRSLTTQYQESDFAFVTRLLAEAASNSIW